MLKWNHKTNMCNPVILHQCNKGYVCWCPQCDFIHVAFGTGILLLRPEQYLNFSEVIAHDLRTYTDPASREQKAFVYSTDSERVRIVLNYKELVELRRMLCESILMYEVHQLLKEPSGD